jgi:hypothetical protein
LAQMVEGTALALAVALRMRDGDLIASEGALG